MIKTFLLYTFRILYKNEAIGNLMSFASKTLLYMVKFSVLQAMKKGFTLVKWNKREV